MNNLTDLNYLKNFLKQSGLKPKHYLGQNFLVDEWVLTKIIDAAELKKTDMVLEVGPGVGTMTFELLKKAGRVIAVEKDDRLFEILRKTIPSSGLRPPSPKGRRELRNLPSPPGRGWRVAPGEGLELIHQDILKFNLEKEIQGAYKVVANIPYYLTLHLIQYFLAQKNTPKLMVLMVQKEVAERIVAKPGQLSLLAISVQMFGDAEIAAIVPKQSFWPVPKVDSAILRIEPKNKYSQITDYRSFFRIIKIAFAGKRKQIHNTLKNLGAIEKAGIDPKARPQELSLADWIRLYLAIDR